MKTVVSDPELRDLAFGSFAFGGLQAIFAGFFILFLIDGLEFSEIESGKAFAIASFTAVGARIFWGYIGSRYLSARIVLGFIGIVAGIAAILTGLYDTQWSYFLVLSVAILYNVTALSWHGILLAEISRLTSSEKVAGVTGGVLAFTSIAMMIYPAAYGVLLAITDSYGIGFILCSIPSFIGGVILLRNPVKTSWIKIILNYISWILHVERLFFCSLAIFLGAMIGLMFGVIRII